jgi:hypothetical protein
MNQNKWATRAELARQYPGIFSVDALAHLAMNKKGPPFFIRGKAAIYCVDDVEQWLEEQRRGAGAGSARRRRGRPTKIAAAAAAATRTVDLQPRRPRGRPRKIAAAAAAPGRQS